MYSNERGASTWVGDFVWTDGSGRDDVDSSHRKYTGSRRRTEREMRLLKERVPAHLRQVASGSATLGLWLRYRNKRSLVDRMDRCRVPGRKNLENLHEEEKEPKPATD